MEGFKIDPDGTATVVVIDPSDTLNELYRLMGCRTVDAVRLAADLDMWVDDDGMFSSPPNRPATMIAWSFGPRFQAQKYYGTAVFLGGADDEGDTVGLSLENLSELIGWAEMYTPMSSEGAPGNA